MLNLATLLSYGAAEYPDKTAVVFSESRMSYQALNVLSNQIANGLSSLGIGKGDKVALTCPNLPYFPAIYFAILKLGAVVVPLNILLKGNEIAYYLNDSDAKAYFCFEGTPELNMGQFGRQAFNQADACEHFIVITADMAAPPPYEKACTLGSLIGNQATHHDSVATALDDTAVILYTSGTTGQAKGAELTHSNIMFNAMTVQQLFNAVMDDVMLIVLPLFHSFGQVVQMVSGLLTGCTLVLLPKFEPEKVLEAMQQEAVSIFCGVPTMYWALLNIEDAEKKYDIDKIAANLRIGISGGSAMPVEIMTQFSEKYHIQILEGYGLSETSPVATFNKRHHEPTLGSVGTALLGVELRIVDSDDNDVPVGEVGEVLIRGHNVMKSYYNRPDETAQAIRDGWFHSGDLGKLDQHGNLYIVDRLKDMIIRGGYNVYPREIEEQLLTHPAVSLAAVIGKPDPELGEEIQAHIMLKPGQECSENDLIDWCKENMAAYKYPREIKIRDSLPMTATGKVLKRELA